MQGRERADRQLLDAGALVGHLVPTGSMFAFLAAHRQELFGDEDFADLFPSGKGRPSVPASVMASVMVLQVLRDYSSTRTSDVGCRDYVQMAGLEHAGNRLPALGIRQGHSLGRQREQGVLGLVRLVRGRGH
jgi:hypothetical protein